MVRVPDRRGACGGGVRRAVKVLRDDSTAAHEPVAEPLPIGVEPAFEGY
jgi:hypothetical protein